MPPRFVQVLLVLSLLWVSWLTMMLVHEAGHVIGARLTGGRVRQVIWHPLLISRTDVKPNPHPLIEVWSGPLVGSALPLLLALCLSIARLRIGYLIWFIAGFCLIANGAYIGVGAIDPVGDAQELVALGTPRAVMVAFGILTLGGGLFIWHRVSNRLGFGRPPRAVAATHAMSMFAFVIVVTLLGFVFGNRGY